MSKINIKNSVVRDVVQGNKGLNEKKTIELIKKELKSDSKNLDYTSLKKVANDLLKAFTPQSLINHFPDASANVIQAIKHLEAIDRNLFKEIISKEKDKHKQRENLQPKDLLERKDNYHLIIAPGGSGKTHILWHVAQDILKKSHKVPIYISLGDFSSIEKINAFLNQKSPSACLNSLAENPNIVFLLDGWSDFAFNTEHHNYSENKKLLGILGSSFIIATGRYSSSFDSQFEIWQLEEMQSQDICEFLSLAFPDKHLSSHQAVHELLKLPFALLLYALLGGDINSKTEILERFYKHLTENLPNNARFLKVLSISAASIAVYKKDKLWCNFENEIQKYSEEYSVYDAENLFKNCGVFKVRQDIVQAVHDLYWEWLVGKGILYKWIDFGHLSIPDFNLRNSIRLALTKDNCLDINSILEVASIDITLAAGFLPFIYQVRSEEKKGYNKIVQLIGNQLESPVAIDKYRAAHASFLSQEVRIFEKTLSVVDQLIEEKADLKELESDISSEFLWSVRDQLTEYIHANTNFNLYCIISVINSSREEKWAKWIEKLYSDGLVSFKLAISVFFSCSGYFPFWIEKKLLNFLKENGNYYLVSACDRGDNISLAYWVLENYKALLQDGDWWHLNKLLVKCGDEEVFTKIIASYEQFPGKVQESLSYALNDRGGRWIKIMQLKLIEKGSGSISHMFFDNICPDLPDDILRSWADSKDLRVSAHGWKVLAKKYQTDILEELIQNLPDSFSNIHCIPALKALAVIDELPSDVEGELWKRLNGKIQPMAGEDFLYAIYKVKPSGILSVLRKLLTHPKFLPSYHLARFCGLLKNWEKLNHTKIRIKYGGHDTSIIDWLILCNLEFPDLDFLNDLCGLAESNFVFQKIAALLKTGDERAKRAINRISLKSYQKEIFSTIFDSGDFELTLKVFRDALHTVPDKTLLSLSMLINSSGNEKLKETFLYYLSKNPSKKHILTHKYILKNHLAEWKNIYHFSCLASLLAAHEIYTIKSLTDEFIQENKSNALWVLRSAEKIKGQLIFDESYNWRN